MPKEIINFYNITSEEGRPVIEKWNSILISTSINGKNESYYSSSNITKEYPTDIKLAIMELKEKGYQPFRLEPNNDFDIKCQNPLMLLRLWLLSKRHVLLEKVYDDALIQEGMTKIAKYIHYIDIETGNEFVRLIETILIVKNIFPN